MVRPQFGPPRMKPRSYGDGHRSGPREGNYSPNSKPRRDTHSPPGKPSGNWRESRGRGRPPPDRKVPPMEDHREPRFNNWRQHNQDSYQSYPHKMEAHHNQRRPPSSRPNRSPHAQHQSRSPAQGSPGHRGPAPHGHSSAHRSPSPRHFRGHPGDKRPGPAPAFQGSFRESKRQPAFPPQEQRYRPPRGDVSPRERPFVEDKKRWNNTGAFFHPHNGQHGPPGPHRSPREMHGRGSCPERWSSEQDSRRQRGPMERQGGRPHNMQSAKDVPRQPLFRPPPPWKGVPPPPSSFHRSPQDRQLNVPRKRRISDVSMSSSSPPQDHSGPKFPRRERVPLLSIPRPFGARPLSLREKSLIFKGRQMRFDPPMRLRNPPPFRPRPQMDDIPSRGPPSSVLALRKKRFQPNPLPLKRLQPREARSKQSPGRDDDASSSLRETNTRKEKVESRRSLNTHRSSPIEKRDLVVVSHWAAGPSTSKEDSPAKDCSPKSKTDTSLSNRSVKAESRLQSPDRKRGYLERRTFRPVNLMPDRRPGPMQRPKFPGPARGATELSGNFRRPLMENLVPRPFPNQKPVFRKSHSIMSKYRNMRVMKHRAPYN
ncbi:serine/arginine repetitive matrix protein 1 isoform X2 [Corythoichthys intestinalis]|uniref:serine/arginine repetitive matrix protein 1 isoform X2 n=1 Tax=Corythoichthys intestinalis TaxID=161448 RepID=UPI0025A514A7|nr:serine/arginine repetitive matrix protein 1 isoform X2 [Corythoichthys intestinalis]